MSADQSNFGRALKLLTDVQGLRVWSLIVSLFGDLAQSSGDQISSAALGRVMQVIGIKPEAMRVALHRLRRDGWIESIRSGRNTWHQLTPFGREQSARVSPAIYRSGNPKIHQWHILVAHVTEASRNELGVLTRDTSHVLVGGVVAIGAGPAPKVDDVFSLEGGKAAFPDWLKEKLCPPELLDRYLRFEQVLEQVAGFTPQGLTAPQRAALRALIVHNWRRLVLRHPDLPAVCFPKDWRGPTCREKVHSLLSVCERPRLEEL